MVGNCKLCLQTKNLCQSHIIPEFIYKPLYSSKHKIIEVQEGIPRLMQKGYREELLCQDCEKYLNDNFEHPSVEIWDTLTSRKASKTIILNNIIDKQKNHAIVFSGVNYSTFKLFLLSIIWRASISKAPEFGEINLALHEEKIRQMLIEHDPGKQSHYPCIINLLADSSFTPIYIPKTNPRYEGHRVFRMILTNVLIWYVISSHSGQADISQFAIKETGSVVATILSPQEVNLFMDVIDLTKKTNIPDYMFK
jgi:hypothetical protein